MRSARAGPLWKNSNGARPQKDSEARVGAGPQKYVLREPPRQLIPYGTIITNLCMQQKRGEEHFRANQKQREVDSLLISTHSRGGSEQDSS